MRRFKTKWFARFARQAQITDQSLSDAITRAERGVIDADLGGGLIKQRVARQGQGRSGGYRMVIAYRVGARAVFLYAFAKNERDNITSVELESWRKIGADFLAASDEQIAREIASNRMQEIVP